MKKIRIKGREDNNKYYLLSTRELNENEIGELVKSYLAVDEKATIIDEAGIKASANQLLVLMKDKNNKYLSIIPFENDDEFIYL